VLARLDRYYDGVPRAAARIETIGPFTLFIKDGPGWPYYARPTIGAGTFEADDVERVRARQRALEVPEAFEWVAETSPGAQQAVAASGLAVHMHPLMVLDASAPHAAPAPAKVVVRKVRVDDDLRLIGAVGHLAFGAPGTAAGDVGTEALAAAATPTSDAALEFQRERLRVGRTVTIAAFTSDGAPVAIGSHQPLDGVSEIVGVGTLPAFRRRGIAAAITALLIEDALRQVDTVFLSAGDEDVARMYGRLGFRRIGTACIAEA
jgi:ribosomal protein S18 acetylase RimI-like enzyme